MKKITAIFLLVTMLTGANCKKDPITPAQQDLLIQIMTDGLWSVTLLTVNSTDYTADFSGYRFKFYENKTVDASFNGTVTKSGTWDASTATMTTSSSFPGATHPLVLVTGSWNITRSGSRFVEATQTVGTEVRNLKMYRE